MAFFHNLIKFKIYLNMNEFENDYRKIKNYINDLISNYEIFDENYIFELSINYCKYSQIKLSNQDIKEIIKSTFNLYQAHGIIENIDNETYTHTHEEPFLFEPNKDFLEMERLSILNPDSEI